MESVTRTIYAAYNQMCVRNKQTITPPTGSTLNDKFTVSSVGTLVDNVSVPTDSYLAIGKGGANYTSLDGAITATPKKHLSTHCSLYDHIPFIARPVSDDLNALTGSEKYRLRVVKEVGNVSYAFYFLRVIAANSVDVKMEKRVVNNGVFSSTDFVPDATYTTPTEPVSTVLNVSNPTSTYLIATASATVELTNADINEVINACNLYFNDDASYASIPLVINEIAIVSGVETNIQLTTGEFSVPRKEVSLAQISTFIYKFFSLKTTTPFIIFSFDMGTSMPISDGDPVFSF